MNKPFMIATVIMTIFVGLILSVVYLNYILIIIFLAIFLGVPFTIIYFIARWITHDTSKLDFKKYFTGLSTFITGIIKTFQKAGETNG